jgi:hypothetical protein
VFASLHDMVGSHDALAKIKMRVRVAREEEKADEEEDEEKDVLLVAEDDVLKNKKYLNLC